MGMQPDYGAALTLLQAHNKEDFHVRHGQIVSGVMRYFAKRHDPENEAYWAAVGLLHDLDFEEYPEGHCVRCRGMLAENGYSEDFIHAVASHGYGMAQDDIAPERYMEKVLFAVDELTGLIGAAAVMRPSKSVGDLELKSVKKKFKSPSFAAGVSRETIEKGAQMMGVTLDELIEETILAMRSLMGEMEI